MLTDTERESDLMRTRQLAISALAVSSVLGIAAGTAAAATNFNVTNSGASAYVIDGAPNATLKLTRGQTYTFTVNTLGHPFWITTARGAGDTEANAFASGVTGNGLSQGTITFVVPASAPATLFYQCAFHDVMGGTLTIVSASAVPSLGPAAFAALAALLVVITAALLRRRARI
jgi:hypothetical protein